MDLAGLRAGNAAPAPHLVRTALAAYVAAGVAPGPAGPEAFAGLLRGVLNSLAYSVWLAVGHRPVDPSRRARAVEDARGAAAGLPVIVASLRAWSALLE